MRYRCKISKFRRLVVVLIVVVLFYIFITFIKLINNFDDEDWSHYEELGQKMQQSRGKAVKWKTTYWMPDEEDVDYDDIVFNSSYSNINNDIRIWPYIGIESEILPLKRSIPDTRPVGCRSLQYSEFQIPVSIIMVFHNEYIGVILRSLISIMRRSPTNLIREIILIDDASTDFRLQQQLKDEVNKLKRFLEIKIFRNEKRQGANWALMQGVEMSTSEVVILMSKIMDVGKNWLLPLIEPFNHSRGKRIVTVPVHQFAYAANFDVLDGRGIFDLQLNYVEIPQTDGNLRRFNTPIMPPNAVFAVNKHFLQELKHDGNLSIGGQDGNLIELSLKIWMCNGRILKTPCSIVFHNYSESGLHDANILDTRQLNRELESTLSLWFDSFSNHVISFNNRRFSSFDMKNYDNNAFIQRQQCKSFEWFLKNVAPDLSAAYFTFPESRTSGLVESLTYKGFCLQLTVQDVGGFLQLTPCLESNEKQLLTWTKANELRPWYSFYCFTAFDEMNFIQTTARLVALQPCSFNKNQQFYFDEKLKTIRSKTDNYCLDVIYEKKLLYLNHCNETTDSQLWQWIV